MLDVKTQYVSEPTEAPGLLPELSLAALRGPQRGDDGAVLPAGTIGTIVATLGGGAAYVVEFGEPFDDVATVAARDLRPVR